MPVPDRPEVEGTVARIARGRRRSDRRRPRLLVVDDEPAVGRTIAHAAEECGYAATLAISSAAFRDLYLDDPPEVVLLDLSLPGADGIELLRFLGGEGARSTIFIVSGFDRRVVESAMRLGLALGLRMGGCLTKPLMVKELAEALGREPGADRDSRHALCLGS
ncbi:response regulator [Allosphingosinicella sp.]|jgi:DNA-binding response OmpR family regulator|uniref:response regulator n=1 Tax=Allosphingosinicella sp. TaxID=2823234 RepID=UPI002EFEBC5A